MKRVIHFSGGSGSWAAAKRIAAWCGTQDLVLLFADTLIEDNDLYRFLVEAAADIFGFPLGGEIGRLAITARDLPGIEFPEERACALAQYREQARSLVPGLEWIAEGRTPWQVFFDVRLMGNSRMDPCSKILKRQFLDKWSDTNSDREKDIHYVGIDWTEEHRFSRLRDRKAEQGWTFKAPLCEPPFVSKEDVNGALAESGIPLPRLYKQGFPHNNCGGFCIKAGQGHFALLLKTQPERYAFHEAQEEKFRQFIGKDVSIMKDRRGGTLKPLPMAAFRQRVETGDYDKFEYGGCGCAIDDGEVAA